MSGKSSKFSKGEFLWYHKSQSSNVSNEIQARDNNISLLKVEVLAVHYDDYPNVYYTIRMCNPPLFLHNNSSTISPGGDGIFFYTEKQTDESHLFPFTSSSPSSPSPSQSPAPQPNSPSQADFPLYFPYHPDANFSVGKKMALNELALRLLVNTTDPVPKMNLTIEYSKTYGVNLLCRKDATLGLLKQFVNLYFDVNPRYICRGKILKDEGKTLMDYFHDLKAEKILLLR